MTDPAVQPSHYTRFKIEPRDFIQANKLGYAVGNIIKYVCRFDGKDGIRDLEKAKNYLEYLIAQEKAKHRADYPNASVAPRLQAGSVVAVPTCNHHRITSHCPICLRNNL